MFESDALIHYGDRLFLARTLDHGQKIGRIDPEHINKTHQETAALAHKLITIKVEDLSSRAEIRGQVQEAFTLASLGLEYGCQGNLNKAVSLLNRNRIIKFFQIGNTIVDKLVERAQYTLEKALLVSPETPTMPFVEREEIPIYNEREREFLESITKRKLVVDAAQVILDQLSTTPRTLMSLADIAIANRLLDYLDYRFSYVRAFPQEKIFAPAYRLDADGDIARTITTALMVNLILYREIDFHLNQDDWDNFRDIAYDVERGVVKKISRNQLIGWIGHYMDLAEQPQAVKKYAIEYWRYCLKGLEAELQQAGNT